MNERFENFTISIAKSYKLISKIKIHEMKDYNFKAIHIMIIYYLGGHESGLTASQLSKLTLDDKAALSRALEYLKKENIVIYTADKYCAPIVLTDYGKQIAQVILDKADKIVNEVGKDLSDEERKTFYHCLNIITTQLETYYETLVKDKKGE